ncbi:MAG: YqgE/AlgH family protein [Gammaproteobacteria bacterium]
MIEIHAHLADVAPQLVGFRGYRFCTALLLMLAFLCLSGALSAHIAATSRTPIVVKSSGQLDSPEESGSAVEAKNIPSYRPSLQRGTLLVASRYLADPNFAKAVVLLVDYGAHGAMGLIINRPTRTSLSKVFPAITPLLSRQDRLYIGGPVAQEQIVLLLRTERHPKEAAHVFANIFFSANEDTLRQVLSGSEQGESFHAYVGHAGWGPGQLEDEVSRGDWHLVLPDSRIVFDAEPSEIWHELLRQSAGLWVQRSDELFLSGYAP